MKAGNIGKIQVLLIVCCVVISQIAWASDIKERMIERLPVITELKNKGIVGEDNRGYLGYVGAAREAEAVVAAENRDRKAIYTHFAKQQNTTIEVVEKAQADRKAQKTLSGQYFQTPEGQWVRK